MQQSAATTTWLESVYNIVDGGHYHVDVVLILGDANVDTTIQSKWRQQLPPATSLTVWADAIPWQNLNGLLVPDTAALSLQHRSVIKDQWFNYDVFMHWEANTRIKASHVDYFLKQSQMLSSILIPGFFEIGRAGNQTHSTAVGPFQPEMCCSATETNFVLTDETVLEKAVSIQRQQDNAQMILLPVSSEHLHGWMMTQRQLLNVVGKCPPFLPSVDDKAGHCSWDSFLDLDPKVFSNHFVEQAVVSSGSLSPNSLWKELGQKVVK